MGNTIGTRPTGMSTTAATTPKAAASSSDPIPNFNIDTYLKSDAMMGYRNALAGCDGKDPAKDAQALASSEKGGWVKSFDDGVKKRVAALGHTPSADEMKDIASKESFSQMVFKNSVQQTSSRIMQEIKDMQSDGWGDV